jgi:hypothetical protein
MSIVQELDRRMTELGGILADVVTNHDNITVYAKRHKLDMGSVEDVWKAIILLTRQKALLYEVDPNPISLHKEIKKIEMAIYAKKQKEIDEANARAGIQKREDDAAAIKAKAAKDKKDAEEARQEVFRREIMQIVHKASDATSFNGNYARSTSNGKVMDAFLATLKAKGLTWEQQVPLVKQKFLELPKW